MFIWIAELELPKPTEDVQTHTLQVINFQTLVLNFWKAGPEKKCVFIIDTPQIAEKNISFEEKVKLTEDENRIFCKKKLQKTLNDLFIEFKKELIVNTEMLNEAIVKCHAVLLEQTSNENAFERPEKTQSSKRQRQRPHNPENRSNRARGCNIPEKQGNFINGMERRAIPLDKHPSWKAAEEQIKARSFLGKRTFFED